MHDFPRADLMTERLDMCTRVKDSVTQEESQNFTRPHYQWFVQHLSQMLVNPPLTECCRSTVDSLGSGQSLAYDLFLMDLDVQVSGSRLCGQDRIGMEIDVSVDLVSSSYCGVRSHLHSTVSPDSTGRIVRIPNSSCVDRFYPSRANSS